MRLVFLFALLAPLLASANSPYSAEYVLTTAAVTVIPLPVTSSGKDRWVAIHNKGENVVDCYLQAKGAAPSAGEVSGSGWPIKKDGEVAIPIPNALVLYCTVETGDQSGGAGIRVIQVFR